MRSRLQKQSAPTPAQRHSLVGPAAAWKIKRDFQIDFLKANGLTPAMTLVDIGCGTLRGGIPIIDYLDAGGYAGVDVRDEVAGEARDELAQHGLERKSPTLVFGPQLAQIHLDCRFDVAWAFAVLIHLTDDHLDECFAFVREHLADDGVFYANVNLGVAPKTAQWREFPVVWRELESYRSFAAAAGFAVETLGTMRELGDESGVGADQEMLKLTRSS